MISMLAKLLILIDDQGEIKKGEMVDFLPEDKKSIIFSGLARLKKKGLIKTKPDGRFRSYKITKAGQNLIYQNLDWLKTIDRKKKWYLVASSIPETKKVIREQLRKALQDIGMILVQRGLCLGQQTDAQPIKQLINRYGVGENVQIFEVINPNLPDTKDYSEVEELYNRFIENSKSFLRYVKRFDPEHLRFRSKTLVFLLSQAVKKDSGAKELSTVRAKSMKIYQQIRDFCYD
jgi:DNA-binding transcriptional regulator PaaX